MTTRKELIVATIMLLFNCLNSFALKYTTLSDGLWNDNVSVWSLDGSTACSCKPAITFSNDTVEIGHDITMIGNIYVATDALLILKASGSLQDPNYNMKVGADGDVIVKGYIHSKKFVIVAGGEVSIISGLVETENQATISGILNVDGGRFFMNSGNFLVNPTGIVNLTSCWLRLNGGNIQNDGIINLDACCMETTAGNVINDNIMAGNGVVYAHVGNVKNTASWSLSVDYCVGGTSFGMPLPGNCPTTVSQCSAAYTLPVELVSFDGAQNGTQVDLTWVTASESNSDLFILQRSADTQEWSDIGIVPAAGNSSIDVYYHFRDDNAPAGINYYRLLQIDIDGTEKVLPVIAVNVEGRELQVVLAPNPGNEFFNLYSIQDLSGKELHVTDLMGRPALSEVLNGHSHRVNTNEIASGSYVYRVVDLNGEMLASGHWVKE